VIGTSLGCLVALVAIFGFVNGIRWARASYWGEVTAAAVTTDTTHIAGPVVQKWLEATVPAGQLKADAMVLASHGLSFYSDPQAVARYRHLATSDTQQGLFKYTQPLPTQVQIPQNGAVVSGRTLLVASAAQNLQPIEVHFVLSGGAIPPRILVAKHAIFGWTLFWNASTVPNGAYQLTSIVVNRSGVMTRSLPVSIVVRNDG
jgi:hypothetical protein